MRFSQENQEKKMKTKTRVVPYGFDSQISFNFNVQLILITDFGRGNQFNTIFFFSNIIFNQKKKEIRY